MPSSDKSVHVTSIDSHFLRDGYRATCSCGWQGEEKLRSAIAEVDAYEHLVLADAKTGERAPVCDHCDRPAPCHQHADDDGLSREENG